MLDILNAPLFTLFGAPVTLAEALGFATGGLTVWLIVRQRVANFPVGIANNAMFLVIFVEARLWADGALQILYMGLAVMGWVAWLRFGPRRSPLRVTLSSGRVMGLTVFGVVALTLMLHPVLVHFRGAAPLWDALTTSLSLAATVLLNLKRLENWALWLAADLIYVPLYWDRDLKLTALIYLVFLGMVMAGFLQWHASMRRDSGMAMSAKVAA